jgi:hypothetical protein
MNDYGPDARPIPRELHSEYAGRPFRCCTRCGEGLLDYASGYKISKVVKQGEVIFEYALCYDCMERMVRESSTESMQRLSQFQSERLRPGVTGTGECALCVNRREDVAEFALVGACIGTGLLESHLVCEDCMEAMSQLISEKTRSQWNRFVDENFPGVPADFVPAPAGAPSPPVLL